jgi:hypothetical protein
MACELNDLVVLLASQCSECLEASMNNFILTKSLNLTALLSSSFGALPIRISHLASAIDANLSKLYTSWNIKVQSR